MNRNRFPNNDAACLARSFISIDCNQSSLKPSFSAIGCDSADPSHHTDGGKGVAIHAGQQAFEAIYGSELDLLAQTIAEAM